MLFLYPKSERDDLTKDQLRQLRAQIAAPISAIYFPLSAFSRTATNSQLRTPSCARDHGPISAFPNAQQPITINE
jgi:hypothetical protein